MEQPEIARLVMGYLKEECLDAAAIFAAISSHMLEYRIKTFRNENPTTKVFNTTLNNILQEYKTVFAWIKNKFHEIKGLQSEFNPKDLIKHLETIINTVSGTDPDQNDITAVYDSRASNTETGENRNTEDEKSNEAKLVLGYLQDECPDAAASFAATSSHLSKYRLEVFQKKDSSLTFNGLTLINTLQQYCAILTYIQNELKEIYGSQIICSPGDFIKNLETIFYKIGIKSANNQQKRRRKSVKDDRVNSEKVRVSLNLTKKQESKLNEVYQVIKYVRGSQRQELAKELGIEESLIQQWFQRKRNDDKDRSRIRNISCRNSVDSSATIIYPLPGQSTHQAVRENEMNVCSSSSSTQQEQLIKLENMLQE